MAINNNSRSSSKTMKCLQCRKTEPRDRQTMFCCKKCRDLFMNLAGPKTAHKVSMYELELLIVNNGKLNYGK